MVLPQLLQFLPIHGALIFVSLGIVCIPTVLLYSLALSLLILIVLAITLTLCVQFKVITLGAVLTVLPLDHWPSVLFLFGLLLVSTVLGYYRQRLALRGSVRRRRRANRDVQVAAAEMETNEVAVQPLAPSPPRPFQVRSRGEALLLLPMQAAAEVQGYDTFL